MAEGWDIGGLEKNKHSHKQMKIAEGPVGKAIVAGVRERKTGRVAARVVADTKAPTLTGLEADHAEDGAEVFTDEARGYLPLSKMGYSRVLAPPQQGAQGTFNQMTANDWALRLGDELEWMLDGYSSHLTAHPKDLADALFGRAR